MINFLRTRTQLQWAVFIAWLIIVLIIAYSDLMQGRVMIAIIETVIYFIIFIGAVWTSHLLNNKKKVGNRNDRNVTTASKI